MVTMVASQEFIITSLAAYLTLVTMVASQQEVSYHMLGLTNDVAGANTYVCRYQISEKAKAKVVAIFYSSFLHPVSFTCPS